MELLAAWIDREVVPDLPRIARSFPVLVVVGPRQVGKTTTLERAFPHHNYVSLDDPSLAAMAETQPRDFLDAFPPPVLIDEVQYAPALFRHVKATLGPRPGRARHRAASPILRRGRRRAFLRGVLHRPAVRIGAGRVRRTGMDGLGSPLTGDRRRRGRRSSRGAGMATTTNPVQVADRMRIGGSRVVSWDR